MSANQTSTIAFFDFDGTITNHDTFIRFLLYTITPWHLICGLFYLSPYIVLYYATLISSNTLKTKLISYFYKNTNLLELKEKCQLFAEYRLGNYIRSSAMTRIKWHLEQDHKVVVVSASLLLWVKPWCDKYGLDCIATELEVNNGMISGQFEPTNCSGKEKVRRIREAFDLSLYKKIYAYGNSKEDKAMLSLADKAYYRYFDK